MPAKDFTPGLLWCEKCRDVTEHILTDKAPATCQSCGKRRYALCGAMDGGEVIAMKMAESALRHPKLPSL